MAAPKLRFKEFDKAFSRNTIKELAKIYVGRDLVEDAYSPIKTETHIYPIYSNSVDNEGLYGYYNFEEFNFDDDALTVVGRGAGLGKAFYRQGGFGTIGRLLSLTPKDKSFHPKYLSDYINDKLIIHNESGGIPQLPRSSLENYEVVLPSYEEQTKIASFLSAVDEKISQLTQKHELLSQYKQGMMQKLFSQQIRFKADDGSEFGEWLFSEIGDVFKFKQGKQVSIEDQDLYKTDGSTRFIRIVDLTSTDEPHRYIVDYSKNDLIEKDDLFMVRYGSPGLLGFGYEGVIANNLFRIIPIHPKQVFSKFSYYLFDSLYQQVCQLSSSTTMPAISFASLNTLKVCLPCLEEQTKIAAFLSSIDKKIEVVTQQIEQAKQWKKGLLQQMFV